MSEPGVVRCPRCGGEGLLRGPRECPRCGGIGVLPESNVVPLRPRGIAKAIRRPSNREYPLPRDGVDLSRDGPQYRLTHQRGGRGIEVWITHAELRELHRMSSLLLRLEDGDGEQRK